MKRLLHSKRFRKNLGKWLVMYSGVMMLLITVITYSKYMTKMQTSDNASVSKFDVSINYLNCDGKVSDSNVCNSGDFRPTSTLKYGFNVTKKLEIKSVFTLTIYVHNDFDIKSLTCSEWDESLTLDYETNGEKIEQKLETGETVVVDTVEIKDNRGNVESTKKKITITSTVPAGTVNSTDYNVSIKYTGEDESYLGNHPYSDIITVSYGAIQSKE